MFRYYNNKLWQILMHFGKELQNIGSVSNIEYYSATPTINHYKLLNTRNELKREFQGFRRQTKAKREWKVKYTWRKYIWVKRSYGLQFITPDSGGKISWKAYCSQFQRIAEGNRWSGEENALVAGLWDDARSLNSWPRNNYESLTEMGEIRFGQIIWHMFINWNLRTENKILMGPF